MKVFGDIELVQSNIDFYITLSSINGIYLDNSNIISNYNRLSSGLPFLHNRKASYDELKDYYIQQSLNKYRTNLENSLSSMPVKEENGIEEVNNTDTLNWETNGCFIDEIEVDVDNVAIENPVEDTKTTASASDFLNFVNSQKKHVQPEKDFLDSVSSQKSFVPEGFYLDSVTEFINNQNNEFVENGLFIDTLIDVGSEKFEENSNLFVDQGLFIDDCELVENNEFFDVEEETFDDTYEEDDTQPEILEEEFEDEFSEDYTQENIIEESDIVEDSGYVEEVQVVKETPVIQETQETIQESAPATVREYVKKHPGASYESLCKYYSKKDIHRALELGKIYKRNNKYYI